MFTCVSIDPDYTRIVSVTRSTVSFTGYWYEDPDDADKDSESGLGVVTLGRKLYFAALAEWLDHKARYRAGGDFCGEGTISFDDVELMPPGATLPGYMVERASGMMESVPADLTPGTREYGVFMSRGVPVREYRSTRTTDYHVEMERGDAIEAAGASFSQPKAAAERSAL